MVTDKGWMDGYYWVWVDWKTSDEVSLGSIVHCDGHCLQLCVLHVLLTKLLINEVRKSAD